MRDAAERLLEDESLSCDEGAVDDAIRSAGGDPRAAIRALIVDLAEARRLVAASTSLGYRRGRQPSPWRP